MLEQTEPEGSCGFGGTRRNPWFSWSTPLLEIHSSSAAALIRMLTTCSRDPARLPPAPHTCSHNSLLDSEGPIALDACMYVGIGGDCECTRPTHTPQPAANLPAGSLPLQAMAAAGSTWRAVLFACSPSPAHIRPLANPVSSADKQPEPDHSHPCSAPYLGCCHIISHLACPQDLPAGLAATFTILQAAVSMVTGVICRTMSDDVTVALALRSGPGTQSPTRCL